MNKLIIKEELKWLIEAINEQFATVREYEDRIPQIEFDILMENVRKFYDDLRKLQRINDMHLLPETGDSHGLHRVRPGAGVSDIAVEKSAPQTFSASGRVDTPRSSVQGSHAGQTGFSTEKASHNATRNTGQEIRNMANASADRQHDRAGETNASSTVSESAVSPYAHPTEHQTDDAASKPGIEDPVHTLKPGIGAWNDSQEWQKEGTDRISPTQPVSGNPKPEPEAGSFPEPGNHEAVTPSEPYPSFKVTFEPPAHPPKEHAAPPKKPKKQPEIDLFAAEEPEFSIKLKEARDKTLGPRGVSERIDNLKSAITINDKFMFINELFDGNLREYNETIETLNGFKTLDQAGDYLDLMRRKNFWDTGSNAFKKLRELVEKKF